MIELRQALGQMLPTNTELDEFVCDYLSRTTIIPPRLSQYEGKLDWLRQHVEPVELRLALIRRQAKRLQDQFPPSTSTAPQNPYHPRGHLAAGHKTYIQRKCDEEFERALNASKVQRTLIHGASGVGKSSLMMRAEELSARKIAYITLEDLNTTSPEKALSGFWKLLKRAWKIDEQKEITIWDDLVPRNSAQNLGLLIDEFGCLRSAELAQPLIESLLPFAAKHQIALFISLTCTIDEYFQTIRLNNEKWRGGWGNIHISGLSYADILQLISHLPSSAHKPANVHFDKLLKKSTCNPRRLQCVFSAIFEATTEDVSEKIRHAKITQLIDDDRSYV